LAASREDQRRKERNQKYGAAGFSQEIRGREEPMSLVMAGTDKW